MLALIKKDLVTSLNPILIFGTDTNANGEVLTCSLPVRRASIVKARFVVAAVLTLLTVAEFLVSILLSIRLFERREF